MNDRDAILIRAADELYSNQFITDPTWKSLEEMYETPQLLEEVFIMGQYQLVAMYQKSVRIQLRL